MITPTLSVDYYLLVATVLFGIGAAGVLIRRNALVVLMSIELMLNAANLNLVSFARHHGDMSGHIYVFLVMAVAIAEVAVGLAIIISVFRLQKTVNVDELSDLHG